MEFGFEHCRDHFIVGVDEAGRGPLAGSVVTAAVMVPKDLCLEFLHCKDDDSWVHEVTDSKKISAKKRLFLNQKIRQYCHVRVAAQSARMIDKLNIHGATMQAMFLAANPFIMHHKDNVVLFPRAVYFDGKFIPSQFMRHNNEVDDMRFEALVKGDSRCWSIAAASIIAKTMRDQLMSKIGKRYPYYDWEKNQAYPTKAHRMKIIEHGLSPHHRQSFRCVV